MSVLGLMFTLSTGLAQAQDCTVVTTTTDVQRSLEEAESAYISLNPDALDQAVANARSQLTCLGEELPRTLASRTHRVIGLGYYGVDDDAASRSFAAARGIEPGYRFPVAIAVEGNPLHDEYMQVDLATGTYERVPEPQGRLTFDGRDTLDRPMSWPTIVQIFDDTGALVRTSYLNPSDPMPSYPVLPPSVHGEDPGRSSRLQSPPNRGMLIGAGGALLASGALYGVAMMSHRSYVDPETEPAQLDDLRSRTNGLVVATWVGGGAAVALGAGAFLVGEF